MVIIVRDSVTLPNGSVEEIKRYITDTLFVTGDVKRRAKQNDETIESKMRAIEEDMDKRGLLPLKGKRDVLKLWYEVGKQLDFIDELGLSPRARKHVWRAIHDHAGRLYDHASEVPVRVKERPTTSHFHYCYIVGKKDWLLVKSAGTWTAWYEFMDSIAMRDDERIIRWIDRTQNRAPLRRGWLRDLNRAIRNRLANKDTSVFSDEELFQLLDDVFVEEFGS